ncbi:hypothetical protein QC762_610230 [Podospora pseudocomata]|uniref:Magnesium-dependent phosphatase 1 n=2 Tax=Podospora TaxID=5144 RepID=A0ABY6SIP9_PODCO|nr:hypothetical protein QC762_610230 [Podospora pseudocomata]VBB84775.1 Putative Magnesium-dependent phosphatase 1 [Podospora comata]
MAKAKKLSKAPTSDTASTNSAGSSSSAPTTTPSWLTDSLPLPALIVLDLDYTLWPFYSDIHISPPIRSLSPFVLSDRNGEHFSLFPDAPAILRLLSSPQCNIRLAVASKSPVGDLCREVLKSLRLPETEIRGQPKKVIDVFTTGGGGGLEIYESSKLRHFEVIAKRTGVRYEDMLFFDDERPNFEVESVGVTMKLVGRQGLCWEELEKGIQLWRERKGIVPATAGGSGSYAGGRW